MPREVITQPENRENPVPGAEPGMRGFSVGWNRAGWVQVHMFPEDAESTGDWTIVDLDRPAINRLIRVLRKARDQAYGADA